MTSERSSKPAAAREVRVTRVFRAPRALVFNAWVDPDQISSWFAPDGCDVPRAGVDVEPRAGGRIYFEMVDAAQGAVYPVRFDIVELVQPELLVLASDPQPELGLPHAMVTRVVFEDEGQDTRVTVVQGPHTDEMEDAASAGWSGTLDKLDRLLAT
jgi:uncharacterized protein YndB with AHSA1/START domain